VVPLVDLLGGVHTPDVVVRSNTDLDSLSGHFVPSAGSTVIAVDVLASVNSPYSAIMADRDVGQSSIDLCSY
jgi:hypothetical protein